MEKGDGDNAAEDGIVAEDITQLVEHIELMGAHRLPDAQEWELATPAADLDDAPVLIDGILDDDLELETMSVADDADLFTETQADLNELLPPGQRLPDRAAALAAERGRWQRRVEELQHALAERDQLIAERDRRIEELSARLATRTLEREELAAELQAARPAEPAMAEAVPLAATSVEALETPAATTDASPDADYTLEVPVTAPRMAPQLRRYLIGLDVVGCVHEVTSRISIGRTRDNDLRIVDPTVSRLHAMLTIRNGEAMLVDANSRNGIFVNGIQMRYAKLDDGDVVTFGTVRFRYRVGSDAAGATVGSA